LDKYKNKSANNKIKAHMKWCTNCKEMKSLKEFYSSTYTKDGLKSHCKTCHIEGGKRWKKRNPEKIKQYSVVWNKNFREKNPHYDKERYDTNPKPIIDKSVRYKRKKRKEDPHFRLKDNIRRLINLSLQKGGYSKNSKTQCILGCSYDEFVYHIQSQFQMGMNWDNVGEWELDHIIPISSYENQREIYLLNHYTNFQPLWASDNLKKSNTYKEEDKLRYLDTLIGLE